MSRLRQLECFVTVAEEGQMTRAARVLKVAQPALSYTIAQLEAELGIELFERRGRSVGLTRAGETLLPKARAALCAIAEAERDARAHVLSSSGAIEFGFLGVPPAMDSPGPFEDFADAHPDIEIRFRELPFPSLPTKSWIAEVDVAVCHLPPPDPDVWAQELRREPRAVLAPKRHPLAEASSLRVAEILDETFIGLHPAIEPAWAGFWSLDDHRDGPAAHLTRDRAANPQEVLASLAVRCAITTVPASVAQHVSSALTGVVAIALPDADPSTIALVGHEPIRNPHVDTLRAFAGSLSSWAA